MIKIIMALVFAFAGLFAGYLLIKLSDRITAQKAIRKNIKEQSGLFSKGYMRLIICMANASTWGLASWWTGDLLNTILISILCSLAFMIAIIDFRIYIIPNELVITTLICGILFQLSYFGLRSLGVALVCMVGIVSVFLLAAALLGFNKVGAGDIKLAGVMGLVLGYPHILTAVLAMCLGMSIFVLIGLKTYRLNLKSMFAYGPFMMVGMIVALASIVGKVSIF